MIAFVAAYSYYILCSCHAHFNRVFFINNKLSAYRTSPLAKAIPCSPCSTAAIALSKAPRVGFPVRLYSKPFPWLLPYSTPCKFPRPFCAKVVARLIGGTTAPVNGSGSLPTWTHIVAKLCLTAMVLLSG